MATVLKSGDRDKHQAAAQNASAIAGFNLSDLADEGRTRLEQCRLQVQEMLAVTVAQVSFSLLGHTIKAILLLSILMVLTEIN